MGERRNLFPDLGWVILTEMLEPSEGAAGVLPAGSPAEGASALALAHF